VGPSLHENQNENQNEINEKTHPIHSLEESLGDLKGVTDVKSTEMRRGGGEDNASDLFYSQYLDKIKEPIQFISIMFALISLGKDSNCIINNPILFDASCNGLQHLSSMTRDLDMAIKVNVVKVNIDYPNDFYQYAADLIQKELDIHSSDNLKNLLITRSLIKKSVMTIPYNISLYGVLQHMKEFFSWERPH